MSYFHSEEEQSSLVSALISAVVGVVSLTAGLALSAIGNWGRKPGKKAADLPDTEEVKKKAKKRLGRKRTWPPAPPQGPKPAFGQPGAAEWRYQRYLYDQYRAGKGPDDVLPFDSWKASHFDPAEAGGRPGRPGGPAQVNARRALELEGFQNVENVELGGHYPDMVRPNAQGGTDYVEVGEMLQSGIPEARERRKLAEEVRALGKNDTITFVDKNDITNRITYGPGDVIE